jgi:hypothetical protein
MKVSQDYFDTIVGENVNDFDMSEEEAIADAINQIKSQGADINLICTFSTAERKELVDNLQALKELSAKLNGARVDEADAAQAIARLSLVKAKFEKNISFRCYATSLAEPQPNAYKIFIGYLTSLSLSCNEKCEYNYALIEAFLAAFQAYLTQQSDVLDDSGKQLLINLTNEDKDSEVFHSTSSVLSALLKCINASCQMNEPNRQFFVENGLCENLMKFFSKHKGSDMVISDACQLIRSLLLDDDVRCEFGKAHEHAKYIAAKLNGLDVLLEIGLGNKAFLIL